VDSVNGSDSNPGTLAEPWKTIAKVNATTLSPGQSVGFKSGGVWRETLTPGQSGASGNPITFSAYGTGADPLFLASTAASTSGAWTSGGSNLWYDTVSAAPATVWMDGSALPLAASQAALIAGGTLDQWWWDGSSKVYVNSGSNSVAPTDVGGVGTHAFEIPQRDNCSLTNLRSYIVLDSLDCAYTNSAGMSVSNSDHVTVQNSTVSQTWKTGMIFAGDTNLAINNNTVSYAGRLGTATTDTEDASGVSVDNCQTGLVHGNTVSYSSRNNFLLYDGRSSNITFEYNVSHHAGTGGSLGYFLQIYSSTAPTDNITGTVVQYNYSYLEGNSNLVFNRKNTGTKVFYNSFATPGQTGDSDHYNVNEFNSQDTTYDTSGALFYGNVFYIPVTSAGAAWRNVSVGFGNARLNGAIFENNIFWNGSSVAFSTAYSSDSVNTVPPVLDYNLYYMPSGFAANPENVYESTWAAYQAAGYEAHGVNADPLFTSPSTGDYTLQTGSPAIGAGVYIPGVSTANPPNIGAH
jgi:hypothetical protein